MVINLYIISNGASSTAKGVIYIKNSFYNFSKILSLELYQDITSGYTDPILEDIITESSLLDELTQESIDKLCDTILKKTTRNHYSDDVKSLALYIKRDRKINNLI